MNLNNKPCIPDTLFETDPLLNTNPLLRTNPLAEPVHSPVFEHDNAKNLFGSHSALHVANTLHINNSTSITAPTPDFQANRIDINRSSPWTSRADILQPSPVRAAARLAAEAEAESLASENKENRIVG